ncbi:hypothetical protein FB451DRAFT_1553114 [Mycena latifolia]|nr:hypothetical protein FB451DRAFT_1553114 [Mycena latifolia]
MPGIELLTLNLLGDIMLRTTSIDEKFVLPPSVSALAKRRPRHSSPLVVVHRSGLTTTCIQFRFTSGHAEWPADALKALVSYAGRIEILDVEFRSHVAVDVKPLLDSDVQFPKLKSLRLRGAEYSPILSLSLSAPQLRALDIERFNPNKFNVCLVPSLENIRLSSTGDAGAKTLSDIFARCLVAWRVVLRSALWYRTQHEPDFQTFARRPLAPALRELELQLEDEDLERSALVEAQEIGQCAVTVSGGSASDL